MCASCVGVHAARYAGVCECVLQYGYSLFSGMYASVCVCNNNNKYKNNKQQNVEQEQEEARELPWGFGGGNRHNMLMPAELERQGRL